MPWGGRLKLGRNIDFNEDGELTILELDRKEGLNQDARVLDALDFSGSEKAAESAVGYTSQTCLQDHKQLPTGWNRFRQINFSAKHVGDVDSPAGRYDPARQIRDWLNQESTSKAPP
ncbi:hypothetical protein PG996_006111 [Apiospora saccharicola]|uniref:Uncharacterized protein n=1 Tax=Apiospora saccharicola TaxID=335842 RepID=A0ABR1VNC9_9PEZI